MKSRKTTDWSFIRHEEGERLCEKQLGLKEFASYTSFFEQQNFSLLAEKKWVNARTFFCNIFHLFALFASNVKKTCKDRFDDFSSNNLC